MICAACGSDVFSSSHCEVCGYPMEFSLSSKDDSLRLVEPQASSPPSDIPCVDSRSALSTKVKALIHLGKAPDGLPLLLRIDRSLNHGASVGHIMPNINGKDSSRVEMVFKTLETIRSSFETLSTHLGIISVGDSVFYRSNSEIGRIMGATIMQQALGQSRLPVVADWHGDKAKQPPHPSRRTRWSLEAIQSDPSRLKSGILVAKSARTVPAEKFLLLALDGTENSVVTSKPASRASDSKRPFLHESLASLPSTSFSAPADLHLGSESTLLHDRDAYLAYLSRLRSRMPAHWFLSRREVLQAIVELSRRIYNEFHANHMVHADITPQNILLTETGLVAIDPIRAINGAIVGAATPGWAPPEQLLDRRISTSSDVYSLALLVVGVLGADLRGEERRWSITKGGSRMTLTVMHDLEVGVCSKSLGMSVMQEKAWNKFLSECLTFDPEKRPVDAMAFANQLELLISSGAMLSGTLGPVSGPGTLCEKVLVDDVPTRAWVITDEWPRG